MGGGRSLAGSFVWPMGLVGLGLCLSGRSFFFAFPTQKLYTYIIYAIIDFICGFNRVACEPRTRPRGAPVAAD